MSDNEVRVRIYITEPNGREVEVEQSTPVPGRTTDHQQVLAVLDSTAQLARSRYANKPRNFGYSTGGNVLPCNDAGTHAWSYQSSLGDPYRVCTRCHKTEDVPL